MRAVALAFLALAVVATPVACGTVDSRADESVRLTADAIAGLARAWLDERLPPEIDRAAIEQVGFARDLVVPRGPVSTAVTRQAGSLSGTWVTLLVELRGADTSGGLATRSVTVTFRFAPRQDVVVAVRELDRRAVVGRGDVRVERRSADELPHGAVHDPDDVIGKEMVRAVAPGTVLTATAVATRRAVRRGAVVNLVLDGAGFSIHARGIASEDGGVGDTIRVVNQASRRELAGRVEDDHTVRIPY
jgi:flagellar basal body P-ring formation protein FlgA